MLAPSTLVPQHLLSTLVPQHLLSTFSTQSAPSAPSRNLQHPVSTFNAFHYEHLRHLQHLQPLFHYLNCFSQHLTVKFKEQNLGIKFYHKVLRYRGAGRQHLPPCENSYNNRNKLVSKRIFFTKKELHTKFEELIQDLNCLNPRTSLSMQFIQLKKQWTNKAASERTNLRTYWDILLCLTVKNLWGIVNPWKAFISFMNDFMYPFFLINPFIYPFISSTLKRVCYTLHFHKPFGYMRANISLNRWLIS